MIRTIDTLLDTITMYRLVLYYLLLLCAVSVVYTFLGVLAFNPWLFMLSGIFITLVCWGSNKIFASVFAVAANVESVYISALILILLLNPASTVHDFIFLFWAGVLTMASKYILTIDKKHLCNPVAIALVLTSLGFNGSASWWIGSASLLPFSLGGLFIVRKLRKFTLVFTFLLTACVTILLFGLVNGTNLLTLLRQTVVSSPIFFLAFVMLTEPLTTPPTKLLQSVYAIIVGIVFAPQFHLFGFATTPELALIIGNVFSYIVSPKRKVFANLQEKVQVAKDTYDFVFPKDTAFTFSPGQYMEWTLGHKHTDSRGNRRYFTIASSPTEQYLRLGVKMNANGSSYKNALLAMDRTTPIVGAQLSGEFTLPKDINEKLVFIAGGIGITPFRSMLKYLLDTNEKRSIVVLYSNKIYEEIAYIDVLNQAYSKLSIPTIYTLTDQTQVPPNWQGRVGRIDKNVIVSEIPDFLQRTFYLSGPHTMVTGYENVLLELAVPKNQIKKDFFPGFV